jgi:hypothetical protein
MNNPVLYVLCADRDSVVGTQTRLRPGWVGAWIPVEDKVILFQNVQTGCGVHLGCCSVVPGFFPGGVAAGSWCWPVTCIKGQGEEWVELYLCSPVCLYCVHRDDFYLLCSIHIYISVCVCVYKNRRVLYIRRWNVLVINSLQRNVSWEATGSSFLAIQEFPVFMEPKGSLPCSQNTTTFPIRETYASSRCPPILWFTLWYHPSLYAQFFQMVSFLQVSSPKLCIHFFFSPMVPHAPSIWYF